MAPEQGVVYKTLTKVVQTAHKGDQEGMSQVAIRHGSFVLSGRSLGAL